MEDKLIDCPNCGEKDACYKIPINEFHNSYSCFGCGFTTNDLMRIDEYDFDQFESTLPELYRDLKTKDSEGRIWYPQAINIPEKGTVFANGKNKDTWQWSAIKTIELTEEEKYNPRFKGQSHKSDSKSLENFGKDFIEACDYIGFFNVEK
jgi:hypothetical protein